MLDDQNFVALESAGPMLDDFHFYGGGGPDAIELCGTARHLTNQGVDVGPTFTVERTFEERITVIGSDGFEWQVWGTDPFGMKAARPRTEAERERWVDHQNATINTGYFSVDRQSMCRDIAHELVRVASFAPDKSLTRVERRLLKKKLNVLADVQMQLMHRLVDMAELRAQLGGVGLFSPQRPYSVDLE